MKACTIIVFTLFAVLIIGAWAKKASPEELLATLQLTAGQLDDAFVGLDPKYTDKIDQNDLQRLYYYGESEFAQKKFIELINKDVKRDICQSEIVSYLNKQPVTHAVWKCTYVKSKSSRQYCFADQILTYVYLVFDEDNLKKFFQSIEDTGDSDELIKIEEVKTLITLDAQFIEKEALNFMKEVGGDDLIISYEEFKDYVTQEDLLDDFRVCRKELNGYIEIFDNECLKRKLIYWTMNHLTELNILTVFDEFEDDKDEDIDVTEEDLINLAECNSNTAKKFIKLMDTTYDGKVCYGEFRTYVRTHTVKLHLERHCATKMESREQKIDCYKKVVLKRVEEFHTPIWMSVPDIDMVFTFELLDKTNDGKISVEGDLVQGHNWPTAVAEKMVNEMDGAVKDKEITLDEFNEFVDWPNVVYGIADCLGYNRDNNRVKCYSEQLKTNIELMMDSTTITEFFKFYDKDNSGLITREEVEAAGVTGENLQNFVDEMGMGDDSITHDEFKWFVRQEELGKMLKDIKGLPSMHNTIVEYIENVFTEYDTQKLFRALAGKRYEIEISDFGAQSTVMHGLIQRMDILDDKDTTVNFVEFWLYWHTPMRKPRKLHLENECKKKHKRQAEEMECYKTEIREM